MSGLCHKPQLRSELTTRHRHVFKTSLQSLHELGDVWQCQSLATARLEALASLLPQDHLILNCWHFLIPQLSHPPEKGEVVAGGQQGEGHSQLSYPQRVACCADGSLIVADPENDRVCRWRHGRGQPLGEFSKVDDDSVSYAVCLDCDGSILATTYQGLARWDWRVGEDRLCQEAASANLADHCGLCASTEGVVVADHLNGRVVRFLNRGGYEELIRQGTTCLGRPLERPCDVTFGPGGSLLVADRTAGRVLRRCPRGELSVVADGLAWPYSLARCGQLLYVGQFKTMNVVRIDLRCGAIEDWRPIRGPTGICFDAECNLYITEKLMHRVLCFPAVFT